MGHDTLPGAQVIGEGLARVAASAPVGVALYRGRFLYVSPGLARMAGLDGEEAVGADCEALLGRGTTTSAHRLRDLLAADPAFADGVDPLLVPLREGAPVAWVDVHFGQAETADGPAWVLTFLDAGRARSAEEELGYEREVLRATTEAVHDGVVVTDAEGRVLRLNPAAERITGWPAPLALGKPVRAVGLPVPIEGRATPADPLAEALRAEAPAPGEVEGVLVAADGKDRTVRARTAPLIDGDGRGRGAVVVLTDLTEMHALEQERSLLARYDPLTGLVNRRAFLDRLGEALETSRSGAAHSLLVLDLDHFRLVNETGGYPAGDRLLGEVASRLRTFFPEQCVLGRIEADEFAVLVEHLPPSLAVRQAERFLAELRGGRFHWEGHDFAVTASLGVVAVEGARDDRERLLRAAHGAVQEAKEEGGDRVHEADPDDRRLQQLTNDTRWVHRLREAIAERRLLLHQQRIEPLGSRRPMAEILVRLRDTDGSVVGPGAFIPVAERYRVIDELDRAVVASTLEALADGAGQEDTTYTINLSGQSLGHEGFLGFVHDRLERSRFPADRICFEITETAAVTNLARARRFMAAVKGLGCRFAIDDFGTGMSSFAYLRNLPVEFLKIDGGFVSRMAVDPVQRALVQSIHHVGQLLSLLTIAESVEDAGALQALREMKVDYAQGFHIGRPEPLGV